MSEGVYIGDNVFAQDDTPTVYIRNGREVRPVLAEGPMHLVDVLCVTCDYWERRRYRMFYQEILDMITPGDIIEKMQNRIDELEARWALRPEGPLVEKMWNECQNSIERVKE